MTHDGDRVVSANATSLEVPRATFQSPYEQYAEHVGKAIVSFVERTVDDYDREEVGLMYDIVLGDGTSITAWPEEIFEGTGWEPSE